MIYHIKDYVTLRNKLISLHSRIPVGQKNVFIDLKRVDNSSIILDIRSDPQYYEKNG
jgi:hypothetical protein